MAFWLCVTTGGRVVLSEKPHGPVLDIIIVDNGGADAWRAARSLVQVSQFVRVPGHGFYVKHGRRAC